MAREGLASRADVWQYFYARVGAILARRGIRPQGWQEIALREAGGGAAAVPATALLPLAPRAWIWNVPVGDDQLAAAGGLAPRLANAGFDVVLAPAGRYYLDIAQLEDGREPGHDWAGHVDLDAAFGYDPFALASLGASYTQAGRAHVTGLEATLFTELVHDPARLDYMVMPRLLALAARAWSPEPGWVRERDEARAAQLQRADWQRFAEQTGTRVLPRLEAEGAGIRYRIPPPGLKRAADGVHANSLLPGFTLRYTSDGSEPTVASAPVAGPVTAPGTIRVAAFARDGRGGPSSSIDPTNH
jgi:hexosaminidase